MAREMRPRVLKHEEIISEGKAKIIVPRLDLYRRPDGAIEPAWAPVFYNPLMKLNRDITILLLRRLLGGRGFFIEALGGTGVRGVRLGLEVGLEGIINDVDPEAYWYITRNIRLNSLNNKIEAYNQEANTLLNGFTFSGIIVDYVDIDPYGSPIPYIDSAVKPLGRKGFLGVTATDTGPLTCSYPWKMLRRYGVKCIETDFPKELGLRTLIYNIVFRASGQDVALMPILSYSYKYYYRVIFSAVRKGSVAARIMDKCRGYIWYCPGNLARGFIRDIGSAKEANCSNPLITGPLWICGLGESRLIEDLNVENEYKEARSLLQKLSKEYLINTPYYRYDLIFRNAR
jgi:tRNA (guanine26-N2/guanine27-N2)-dimethyltransferase